MAIQPDLTPLDPSSPLLDDGSGLVLVHDQLADFGGMERVLETMIGRYPAADVISHRFAARALPATDGFGTGLLSRRAQTKAVDDFEGPAGRTRLVGRNARRNHFLGPLYARRIRAGRIESAAVVLSLGSSAWSLAAAVPAGARHVGYIGGPPRALYGHSGSYLREQPVASRPLLAAAIPALRSWQRRLVRRPDRLLTTSVFSAQGLERACGRAAEVVHPPALTESFTPAARPRGHFLAVARLVAHKRIDVAVDAFRGLEHRLVVVGDGPWLERLRAQAPPNVSFAGAVGDSELRELYRSSRALISPSIEEFGLVMVEAQACGVPVIAPRTGGARDIVSDGKTGILLDRVSARSIAEAVRSLDGRSFDERVCRQSAERFSEATFLSRLERILDEELGHAAVRRPRAER